MQLTPPPPQAHLLPLDEEEFQVLMVLMAIIKQLLCFHLLFQDRTHRSAPSYSSNHRHILVSI